MPRSRLAISIAASAASAPLLFFGPDRASAWSLSSVVSTPKAMGTPVSSCTCIRPEAACIATTSKWNVSPRITQPRQMIASWPPFSARASAVTGSSSEPGTQKTSGSLTPCTSRAARAPRNSLFDTSSLKRATTTAMVRAPPLRSGLAPFSPTALEKMSKLVFLGLQVALVVRIGFDADRDALDDLQTESFESVNLLGVVCQQPDLSNAEVVDDLAADAIVPFVCRVTQRLVRLDSIETRVLEVVGVQLVEQSDTATFLVADVKDHAGPVGGNRLHRGLKLRAAVAAQAAENVAGEALGMRSQENGLC